MWFIGGMIAGMVLLGVAVLVFGGDGHNFVPLAELEAERAAHAALKADHAGLADALATANDRTERAKAAHAAAEANWRVRERNLEADVLSRDRFLQTKIDRLAEIHALSRGD